MILSIPIKRKINRMTYSLQGQVARLIAITWLNVVFPYRSGFGELVKLLRYLLKLLKGVVNFLKLFRMLKAANTNESAVRLPSTCEV